MAAWFRSRCLLELTRGKLSKLTLEEGEEEEEGGQSLLHRLLLHLIATL